MTHSPIKSKFEQYSSCSISVQIYLSHGNNTVHSQSGYEIEPLINKITGEPTGVEDS